MMLHTRLIIGLPRNAMHSLSMYTIYIVRVVVAGGYDPSESMGCYILQTIEHKNYICSTTEAKAACLLYKLIS